MRAGSYVGPVGAISLRSPRTRMASRTGAMMRENIVDTYLGRAGIGTHGDGSGRRVTGARMGVFGDPAPVQLRTFGDLCDSAGSTVASAFTAAGGSSGALSTIGATTHDAGAEQGFGIAGALASLVGGLWGQQCTIEAARQGASSPTSSGAPSDMTAAFQQAVSGALAQSTQTQQQATQAALAQQQAQLAQAQQASNQRMLLIGGGIFAAIIVVGGAVLLLRK